MSRPADPDGSRVQDRWLLRAVAETVGHVAAAIVILPLIVVFMILYATGIVASILAHSFGLDRPRQ